MKKYTENPNIKINLIRSDMDIFTFFNISTKIMFKFLSTNVIHKKNQALFEWKKMVENEGK